MHLILAKILDYGARYKFLHTQSMSAVTKKVTSYSSVVTNYLPCNSS